jgi:predicted DNA-binding antitoxin AbrB/MazE fold protein
MSFELEATYENGVLKLGQPLPLAEHQRVKVVVQETGGAADTGDGKDLRKALQEIRADQKRRGFVGTVTEYDSSDKAYEQRMREIMSNTVHGHTGNADLP